MNHQMLWVMQSKFMIKNDSVLRIEWLFEEKTGIRIQLSYWNHFMILNSDTQFKTLLLHVFFPTVIIKLVVFCSLPVSKFPM